MDDHVKMIRARRVAEHGTDADHRQRLLLKSKEETDDG